MNNSDTPAMERKIYSISELNGEIKQILERQYAFVWVSGEISNLSRAASGHLYFTLKDRNAQIAAVIFRTQTRLLKLDLNNGIQVTGFGRISVYEPRGTYQIILEYLEQSGTGKLLAEQQALKSKLKASGLFDIAHKKELPLLPAKIAVITSPKGAVIEDILNVARRRFDNIPIEIIPVNVQGDSAVDEIVNALALANDQQRADVIILARGGGSVEDLQPFNTEQLARAIFDASIPVVSAVGHETDYTISDLVADLRAPTPSAAAELVLPLKENLLTDIATSQQRMAARIERLMDVACSRLSELSHRLQQLQKKLDQAKLRIDELESRLIRAIRIITEQHRTHLNWWADRISAYQPERYLQRLRDRVEEFDFHLTKIGENITQVKRYRLDAAILALNALNPKTVLERGYSITRILPEKIVVRDSGQVTRNDLLEIILANGTLRVKCTP